MDESKADADKTKRPRSVKTKALTQRTVKTKKRKLRGSLITSYDESEYGQVLWRQYHCKKGKRVFQSNAKTPVGTCTYQSTMKFNLPDTLQDDYIFRHELSINDLKIMFSMVPVRYLWMLALSKKFEITTSAIQPCFANRESMTFSGNTVIVDKLLKYYRVSKFVQASNRDKYVCISDHHKPPLPVHVVSATNLQKLAQHVGKTDFDAVARWKDISVLPREWYHGYLKLSRVVPKVEYIKRHEEPENLLAHPFEFLVGGVVFFATTEHFLIQTKKNHTKLRTGCDPNTVIVRRK